jgi:hypothetical protein
MSWANGLRAESSGGIDEIKKVIIRHCSPVLMGCKPAALFMIRTSSLELLRARTPPFIDYLVIREHEGRALVFLFDKTKLENTILTDPVRSVLVGMGYPSRYSLPVFLNHLQKQFEHQQCPHAVGLFLGYPLDDVLGFIKHRGFNYKLCGIWKVYGDVEAAKNCFRQYDLCRERMKIILGG